MRTECGPLAGLRAGLGRARRGDGALGAGESQAWEQGTGGRQARAEEALRGQETPHALGQPGPVALLPG